MPTVLVHLPATNENDGIKTQKFSVELNRAIYDELERQDLKLPHGCLAGSCGSCRIQVISGSENLAPMGAVEADTVAHIEGNYPGKTVRLSCRAKILGDIEIAPLK
jgi:ferredoxin